MAKVLSQSSQTENAPSLSFPRATFAKLSPQPFLLAHLQPSSATSTVTRPNGRRTDEFRTPTIHTDSLSHADGSAVVRTGDTAVVCGVRGEILMESDVPGYRVESSTQREDVYEGQGQSEVQNLGLLVPNLELATGCSPKHLPGQPPSTLAQRLSVRILSLLHTSGLVRADDLRIWYQAPTATSGDEGPPPPEVKAFWTLYIDILFISLDGNPFDAAWSAVVAALANTRLPYAYWDVDREMILCDDAVSRARKLQLQSSPVTSTFSVFSVKNLESENNSGKEKTSWILADPDDFEEEVCKESVVIALDCSKQSSVTQLEPKIFKLDKSGGVFVGKEQMRELVRLAVQRWKEWHELLGGMIGR
ncbi:MAG: hypothetical protein M1837_000907 [Sclerophora amabilis]|nr:MAG: hypothetical protein M1837_000907 [Sclerophora amabilis]